MIYNAEISAGALMLVESKQLARLYLTQPTPERWREAIEVENILQKKTPATSKRQAALVKKRFQLMNIELIEQIANSDNELATQLLFAGALLHSQLLYDYMIKVYAQHIKRLEKTIYRYAWENFWEESALLDPSINQWSTATKTKLSQVILRILSQAKYIETTKNMEIAPFHLRPEALSVIRLHHPHLIAAMEFN
ncbi:DUF1819 family protein [Methylophilus sp.]|uniref:DUF1819 family protein n=1 Tax=Methylophilus sp. TaxID=29541 RepID=UPI0011D53C49|nr:DUF1819 family protein [Methylophilus sp.]TXI44176.1 MAG: DUF1819 family protein [Methylophilus sp.]